MDLNPTPLCPCGKPLHYRRDFDRRSVQRLVDQLGPLIRVVIDGGPDTGKAFMVPRHYIGLHGLQTEEIPALARRYGFRQVT